MKKKYITPSAKFVNLDPRDLIATSPGLYDEFSNYEEDNL